MNPMNNLSRIALVTGGSRGIGLGIAEHLACGGFHIVINGRRDQADVQPVLDQIASRGAQVLYCQADVASAADRVRMIDEIRGRFGRLDLLVNNAGVAPTVRADILEAGEESFDRLININLKGPYFLTQIAANWMIDQRRADASFAGCIINVGSISATVASVQRGDYCISKAGIGMATMLWAARLAEFGIGVYEVRPGIIKTDMTEAVTAKYDNLINNTDLLLQKRWGTPEDIGRIVAAIARGDLPYATGQVIYADGGLTLDRL